MGQDRSDARGWEAMNESMLELEARRTFFGPWASLNPQALNKLGRFNQQEGRMKVTKHYPLNSRLMAPPVQDVGLTAGVPG